MKKIITLTENDLHRVIKESVKNILAELDWKTYANAERKWADHLMKHPDDPRRKSSIIGATSNGTHDIYADDRLRGFQQARADAFNRDYSYNEYEYNRDKGSYKMDWPHQDSGMYGYFDRLRTSTATPSSGRTGGVPHRLKDSFQLDSIDGSQSPREKHSVKVDHVKGRYSPNTTVDRAAVELEYDDIPYMKARNRGNADIEKYQSGKSKYVKGKGWE